MIVNTKCLHLFKWPTLNVSQYIYIYVYTISSDLSNSSKRLQWYWTISKFNVGVSNEKRW